MEEIKHSWRLKWNVLNAIFSENSITQDLINLLMSQTKLSLSSFQNYFLSTSYTPDIVLSAATLVAAVVDFKELISSEGFKE